MTGELKPCPFCGGEAHVVQVGNGLLGEWWGMVQCFLCGSRGPVSDKLCDEKRAIRGWNQRASLGRRHRKRVMTHGTPESPAQHSAEAGL